MNASELREDDFEAITTCPLCQSPKRSLWNNQERWLSAVQCSACELVYMNHRLTSAAASAFYTRYNSNRETKDPLVVAQREKMYQCDKKYSELFIEGKRILDMGCGSGGFLACFQSSYFKVGFDIDAVAIAGAKQMFPEVRFVDNLNEIEAYGPFDAMIFRGTLQYQRNLLDIGAFTQRYVRPGGHLLLLATPNAESPLAMLQRERWGLYQEVEHLYHFSLKTLDKLFVGFGREHCEFPYIESPYENLREDLKKFQAICRGEASEVKFPFWGSMMNVIYRRQG